jgi:hypothetical protein
MLCDVCQCDQPQVIRVDSWQVCQWCVSNNVLWNALDVAARIKKLQEVVATTEAAHQRDVERQQRAEAKLGSAYSDLESAIRELVAGTAESNESLGRSLAATDALTTYQSSEATKSRDARKNKPLS